MYSEWRPVPTDKNQFNPGIKENKKFQIRTDKKIDENNYINWHLETVTDSFTLNRTSLNCQFCVAKYFSDDDRETKGFFQRAGVLTFLKTSTQLQVWFENVLEITWVYKDITEDASYQCLMRRTMTGLRFISSSTGIPDKVSTHFRYGSRK